jgi:hypothetical protein
MASVDASPAGRRTLFTLVLLFIGLSVLMKIPTLIFEHEEPDERIYWAVAENVVARGEYTLRGSEMLANLSPRIYDRPLFHHPPLYTVLLLPFVALDAPQAAVVISWVGHALCIVAVALIGSTLLGDGRGLPAGFHRFAWIPLLGVAVDPLLLFASRKLWIDVLMSGLIALSIALVHRATRAEGRRTLWLLGGGLVLGLAGLAKLPGLMAGGIGLLLIATADAEPRRKLRWLVIYGLPCVLLMLPWLVVFFATYGVLAPDWLTPDAVSLERSRFVARAVGLPWHYYIVKLCILQPLVPVTLVLYGLALGRRPGFERWMPAAWFLLFLVVPTYQGIAGYGFQMRYVAPLMTAVYASLFCHPALYERRHHPLLTSLLVAAITYAAMGGAMYLLDSRYDEFLSIPELMGVLDFPLSPPGR